MKQRKLHVSALSYDSEFRKPYPYIRLRGKWLQNAGFLIGAEIIATIELGRITIVNQHR